MWGGVASVPFDLEPATEAVRARCGEVSLQSPLTSARTPLTPCAPPPEERGRWGRVLDCGLASPAFYRADRPSLEGPFSTSPGLGVARKAPKTTRGRVPPRGRLGGARVVFRHLSRRAQSLLPATRQSRALFASAGQATVGARFPAGARRVLAARLGAQSAGWHRFVRRRKSTCGRPRSGRRSDGGPTAHAEDGPASWLPELSRCTGRWPQARRLERDRAGQGWARSGTVTAITFCLVCHARGASCRCRGSFGLF